jgi:hypothetical protein
LAIEAAHAKARQGESSIRIRTRPKQDRDHEMTEAMSGFAEAAFNPATCCWNCNTSLLADRLAGICPQPIVLSLGKEQQLVPNQRRTS